NYTCPMAACQDKLSMFSLRALRLCETRFFPLLAATAMAIATALQIQCQSPKFEVASVKPIATPLSTGGGPWIAGHGRFKADGAWVRAVIAWAHSVLAVQVYGGPNWLDSERYDIAAKAESANAGEDQIKLMLQSLLAERFKLAVHRETKELPI